MKILQVNNVYGEKSTGKITQELHEGLLRAGHEALVVYGRGKGMAGEGVIRLCPNWYGKANSLLARVTGLPYGGCVLSTLRLQSIIRREKPDVVHLQCINEHFVNIYWLLRWLKKHRIKTVISLHAEFMYTANCGHAFDCIQWRNGCYMCPDKRKATKSWFFDRTRYSWEKMRKAYEGFEKDCVIVPVSPWTENRAKQSAILKDFPYQTVMNGVDTTHIFGYRGQDCSEENTVLHVTAKFCNEQAHPKGGWYLTELARRMPYVRFLVAGKAEGKTKLPPNLTLLGEVQDQQKLAELYRRAKLSIIVSRRETFSMPCAESLCCGTPVVGFKAGAPEQISLPEYSEFIEHGDLDGLEKLVHKWLAKDDLDRALIAETARNTYSVETMIRRFLEVYERCRYSRAN